jgi:hypothetical protein
VDRAWEAVVAPRAVTEGARVGPEPPFVGVEAVDEVVDGAAFGAEVEAKIGALIGEAVVAAATIAASASEPASMGLRVG